MNLNFILIFALVFSFSSFAEDQTAPIDQSLENGAEILGELSDSMMLIWPKIPEGGDPAEVKKAIESQRLLDKIKHGSVALKKERSEQSNKDAKSDSEGTGQRFVFSGVMLSKALISMSGKGHIPPIFIKDSAHRIWSEKVWVSYDAAQKPADILRQVAELSGFTVSSGEIFHVLVPVEVNKRLLKPVSIHADKISLVAVIKSILGSAGLNGVISEELRDILITVQLKQVPALDALKSIVEAHHLEHQELGGIHVIGASKFRSPAIEEHREIIIEKR